MFSGNSSTLNPSLWFTVITDALVVAVAEGSEQLGQQCQPGPRLGKPSSVLCAVSRRPLCSRGAAWAEVVTAILVFLSPVEGHDSSEDARACMELMVWKIKEDAKVKR